MGTNSVRELFTNTKNNYNLPIKMIAKAINKMTVWNKSYIFTDKFWISTLLSFMSFFLDVGVTWLEEWSNRRS